MTETALRIEHRGPVVILENHDPPRNRMTFEYMDELERAVIALRSDRDARAELKATAIELATELAAQPPIAVAGVLRAVVGAEHLPLEDALRIERDAVHRCSSSADQIEGMTAFLEKRRPRFEGR